jgi:hypothetical protein
MTGYFGLAAAGVYETTDAATKLLGRPPRSYTDWLAEPTSAELDVMRTLVVDMWVHQ